MPLLNFDLPEGTTPADIRAALTKHLALGEKIVAITPTKRDDHGLALLTAFLKSDPLWDHFQSHFVPDGIPIGVGSLTESQIAEESSKVGIDPATIKLLLPYAVKLAKLILAFAF